MDVEKDEESEGEDEGGGTQRALEDLELFNQEAEPSVTTLVDSRNGFNELSRLAMLWTVRHRWLAGAIFAFNCYRHWAQFLLRQRCRTVQIIAKRLSSLNPLRASVSLVPLDPFPE